MYLTNDATGRGVHPTPTTIAAKVIFNDDGPLR